MLTYRGQWLYEHVHCTYIALMMARLPALSLKMTETCLHRSALWASFFLPEEAQRVKGCKQVSVERAGNLAIISAVCRPSGERNDSLTIISMYSVT